MSDIHIAKPVAGADERVADWISKKCSSLSHAEVHGYRSVGTADLAEVIIEPEAKTPNAKR